MRMLKDNLTLIAKVNVFVFLILLLLGLKSADASLVTFNAAGGPDINGFIQFDDSFFGSETWVSNTAITDLSLTVYGVVFSLGDVVTTDFTVFDFSGVNPIIMNGAGKLANNGSEDIALYPDGTGGTALDGDASLRFYIPLASPQVTYHAVNWEMGTVIVPEPISSILFVAGGALLAGRRYIKRRNGA